ncbi:MAG: hypothetical protein Q9161_008293 [Pseudevernia consocians]
MEDGIFKLSPIDHTMPRVYNIKILYFPVPNARATHAAAKLRSSLNRTLDALPILSGSIQRGKHPPRADSLCVGDPWNTVDDIFRLKDLVQSGLDYTKLRKQHFPVEALREYDIFSQSLPDPLGVRTPVMLVQVNLVRDGMILAIALHHSCMDGFGFVAVTEIWAKFCRGEDGAELLRDGTLTEQRLMHGDKGGRLSDFPNVSLQPTSSRNAGVYGKMAPSEISSSSTDPGATIPVTQQPKEVDMETFFFSQSKLKALKLKVSASLPKTIGDSNGSQSPSYISTNDALSALIFTCVTRARTPPERAGSKQMIPFVLTVSARRLLDIPSAAGYIGNMVIACHLDLPLCTVRSEISSLASIAQQVRKRLIELDGGHVKRWIGAIGTMEDTRKLITSFRVTKDYPFMITSWSEQRFYDIEWGPEVGIRCERVRILRAKKIPPRPDGLVIIMPELKTGVPTAQEDGGLEVLIALEKGVMHKLKGLEEWTTWAEWRCS